MTSIKLTICIPTYNQPAQLFRLLDIISSEINQFMLEGKVEVKIRDNSENNSTYELFMASKYIDKSWIDYKKNSTNIGLDLNILNLYLESKSDYVWFVGGDDIIYKSSIQKILHLIDLKPDILLLPFQQPQNLILPQYQKYPKIKYWNNKFDVIKLILKYIKITSFVYIRKDVNLNKEYLMNQFNNIGWMHLIIGLEVTNNLENINCISSSEFMAGSLDAEWKILNSTPMSYLLANKLISHEIFIQKKLKNLAIKFINRMYLGGINVTLSVQIGLLQSILNLNEFITFGQKYPVKLYLFCRPLYLLKLFIIKLKLVRTFKSLILFLERLKQKTYNNKQLTYKYINQIFN